jgi:putative SOS response-associated peptidase YedK
MCGRYGLTRAPDRLARLLKAAFIETGFRPRYNIAPTQPVPAILNTPERAVEDLRWGLVPYWSAGPQAMKLSTFNARIETIASAPSYKQPLKLRRCAILADGYYEWKREADGSKTPMWIYRRDGEPFAFAGLWDVWRPRDGGEPLRSCTIITQPPNRFAEAIHSRMPVVLDEANAEAWLMPEEQNAAELLERLPPSQSDLWAAHAVDRRVGNVRFDDAALTAPLESQAHEPSHDRGDARFG